MKLNNILALAAAVLLLSSCGGGSSEPSKPKLFFGVNTCAADLNVAGNPATITDSIFQASMKFGSPNRDRLEKIEVTKFDEKGRIISTDSYNRRGNITGATKLEYDEKGRISKVITYDANGNEDSAYEYSYEGDKITVRGEDCSTLTFDGFNRVELYVGGMEDPGWTIHYNTTDGNGSYTSTIEYDEPGDGDDNGPCSMDTVVYNKNHRVAYANEDEYGARRRLICEYNEHGDLAKVELPNYATYYPSYVFLKEYLGNLVYGPLEYDARGYIFDVVATFEYPQRDANNNWLEMVVTGVHDSDRYMMLTSRTIKYRE